jgi:hypothetical protein
MIYLPDFQPPPTPTDHLYYPLAIASHRPMAYIFELEADCVTDHAAKRFGDHFVGLSFSLPDGRVCRFTESDTSVFTDADGHARCLIVSIGASLTGSREVLRTDDERKEFLHFLYEHLRKAPPFRFAVAGLECHDYSLHYRDGRLDPIEGLVVCDQIFVDAGSPAGFEPFAAGYHWVPFANYTIIL